MVTKEIQVQEGGEDDDDEGDVDEMDKSLQSCSSKVEIDIYKYGSRVKQATSSSFVQEVPEPTKTKNSKIDASKYKTGS